MKLSEIQREVGEYAPLPRRCKNLVGKRFNRLTVLGFVGQLKGYAYWECRCDCGTIKLAYSHQLGIAVKSCGCLQLETNRANGFKSSKGHPKTRTRVWRIWAGMKSRCKNPKHLHYPSYGGRGIEVCERWRLFENFYADMGDPPTSKHSLDRINNDGDYEPSNCRWATQREQCNNQSSNLIVEYGGKRQTLAEFCRERGLHYRNTRRRIFIFGWSVEEAITLKGGKGIRRFQLVSRQLPLDHVKK